MIVGGFAAGRQLPAGAGRSGRGVVDGVQRGSERQGPLGNALGAWHHGAKSDPGRTSCFCEYCAAKAARQGIDIDRVKKAFLALEPYVRAGRAGQRPRDGYYVEFWRILLRHPELLVWETFWADSMREMQREKVLLDAVLEVRDLVERLETAAGGSAEASHE